VKPRPPLPPGPYLVVGLARSGTAAARMLREHGEVIGCDADEPQSAAALADAGVEVHLRSDGLDLLERVQTVVKSPGVPPSAPVVLRARELGLEVAGELELAWRLIPNEFVAITGTNGKTTTVELLGEIHRRAGIDVAVAGNVGTPLASLAGEVGATAVVVCECSSFQLHDATAFSPECAVLLNLTPDHLDWHGSLESYESAKLKVFANQGDGDVRVIPSDLESTGSRGIRLPPDLPGEGAVVVFGAAQGPDRLLARTWRDVLDDDGLLRWRGDPLMSIDDIRLRGLHNRRNAMAASAAALARGIPAAAVVGALETFAGIPNRLEEVRELGGVLFVNDSKATNVAAAVAAICSYEGGVQLIAGGSLKGERFRGLRGAVSERCRAGYLIGEAAGRLADDLAGTVPLNDCGDLERAVAAASGAARAGDVVLLSPACASYDQYADFEERGAHFRKLVARLGERG
jgi:UDP-N-acetylmuramoylalanine--D-glutamate ligase